VLAALVVMAAVTAGAVAASRAAQRAGRNRLPELRASSAAEGALVEALAHWEPRWSQLATGAHDSSTSTVGSAARAALRLDARHVLLEARARSLGSSPGVVAERTASLVARLDPPTPRALGALTLGGSLQLLAGASVDGTDAMPAGWTGCGPLGPDTSAYAANAVNSVTSSAGATVVGAARADPHAVDPLTYTRFAGESWSDLAARAAVRLAPGTYTPNARVTNGRCVLAADAWSGPTHAATPCADVHALVYAAGSVNVSGPGAGQGMLLVDGDLTVVGTFDFAGTIVVRGAVHAASGALRVDGALLIGGNAASVLGAGSRIRHSRCAMTRAMDGIARISMMRRRSWADVTR
jgi:hypothetical protein